MKNKLISLLRSTLLVLLVIGMPFPAVDAIGILEISLLANNSSDAITIEVVNPNYKIEHHSLEDGTEISAHIINGTSHPPEGFEAERMASMISLTTTSTALQDFPSYGWVFGCGAISGAMIAAYYDRNGYPNMYAGPTNGGVMPLTDTSWPTWVDSAGAEYPNNPLVASKMGVDGRTSHGSIDNYWVSILSSDPDPFITEGWPEHDCGTAIGDQMKTSQSYYNNPDGASVVYYYPGSSNKYTCAAMEGHQCGSGDYKISERDSTYGRKLFYEARGYTVTDCYNQPTDNKVVGGFSLADFKAEIDAGHPVFVHVEGHFMVGFGYNGDKILIRDTWDNNPDNIYSMPWGGSYQGMKLRSVGIVRPAQPDNLAPTDIFLSSTSVVEGQPINTVVGRFSTVDPNPGDTFTYTLVSGTGSSDNKSFNISENKLRTSIEFDASAKDRYNIRVRSTDQGDLSVEKQFTISIIALGDDSNIFLPLILTSCDGVSSSISNLKHGFVPVPGMGWTKNLFRGWLPIQQERDVSPTADQGLWAEFLNRDQYNMAHQNQSESTYGSQPFLYINFWNRKYLWIGSCQNPGKSLFD